MVILPSGSGRRSKVDAFPVISEKPEVASVIKYILEIHKTVAYMKFSSNGTKCPSLCLGIFVNYCPSF